MKIIHTADLHLDSRIEGLAAEKSRARRGEVLHTFERICDYATKQNVTAIIIAGDMFDTAHLTNTTRNKVLSIIKSNVNVDFLYLAGNHDKDSFTESLKDEETPSNLKIFSNRWTYVEYDGVTIAGIDLESVDGNLTYDTLKLPTNTVNIVTLHGQIANYVTDDKGEIISLPRLKNKNIDYLALGHYHAYARGVLDDRGIYAYSGCPEGRGFDETGEKGFVLLEIDKGKITDTFIKFSSRNLFDFTISVTNFDDWWTLRSEILQTLKIRYDQKSLIKVVLTGEHKTDFVLDVLELSERLNEYFYFAKVQDKTVLKISEEDFSLDKTVRGEFVRSVWQSDLCEEDKSKIIMLGLKAFRGEEL